MIKATRQYIDGITTALTQEHGIKITAGKTWRADIKHRELEYNPADLTQLDPTNAKGLILHEVGHLLYTKETGKTEQEKQNPIMHEVYNAFEDMRIEKKLSEQYGEFADKPLDVNKRTIVDGMPYCIDDTPASVLRQVLTNAILQATHSHTGQGRYNYRSPADQFRKKTTPSASYFLHHHGYDLDEIARRAMNAETLDELKGVIDTEAYPILKELIDQIPPNDQQQLVKTKENKDRESIAEPFTNRTDDGKEAFTDIPSDTELDQLLAPYIATLTRQLGQVLKERRASKLTGLHKTGKLLSRNAYRVLTNERRIFSRQTTPDKADYKISLLLDGSGSMRDRRHTNAYIGGYLLHKVFKKLGFPQEFIHFHNRAEILTDYTDYREFRDQRQNDDAGALKIAYEHRDIERDNIVIILTDGSICTDVKPWIDKLHKSGAVLFGVGVGIRGNELQKNYGQAVNVPDVENIPTALIGILKRLIHR